MKQTITFLKQSLWIPTLVYCVCVRTCVFMCVYPSIPRCRKCFSDHVESWDLTLALSPFLSVLSAVRQVNSEHLFHLPPVLAALPFLLPVICTVTALHSCSLFSFLPSLSHPFFKKFPLVLFTSLPPFVPSVPLLSFLHCSLSWW